MARARDAAPPTSWFGPDAALDPGPEGLPPLTRWGHEPDTDRLWRGLQGARWMVAVVLVALQALQVSVDDLETRRHGWMLGVALAYLASVALTHPRHAAARWPLRAALLADLLAFSALQLLQIHPVSYTLLFALPVLQAAVLGSRLLALGVAAAASLLLLWQAGWMALTPTDAPSRLTQAGLTGLGFFAVALLANQLASRLAREQHAALRHARAARLQTQVNELVIDGLNDGVLVVNAQGVVRAANPAARRLLGPQEQVPPAPFMLSARPAWLPLLQLAQRTFAPSPEPATPPSLQQDLLIGSPQQNPLHLRARTRLTPTQAPGSETLCVMFLQDLREMEARLRTEKLAAMGRLSVAVAHEIRNPLAAIMQANALLDEELQAPAQRRLSTLVQQNAQRLAQTVDDILDVARAQPAGQRQPPRLPLQASVREACDDWTRQHGRAPVLSGEAPGQAWVRFDDAHLRRVLVNLLDNAQRHAGAQAGAVQVWTEATPSLHVWSLGPPLDPGVHRHLFEPFFSSQSRSSGLGLYICRELCEQHQAQVAYRRSPRVLDGRATEGNEFFIHFSPATHPVVA